MNFDDAASNLGNKGKGAQMTLPYNLTHDQLVLDPITERKMIHGDLDTVDTVTEIAALTPDQRDRVTEAANELFRVIRQLYEEEAHGLLYAACLDTAMTWELG